MAIRLKGNVRCLRNLFTEFERYLSCTYTVLKNNVKREKFFSSDKFNNKFKKREPIIKCNAILAVLAGLGLLLYDYKEKFKLYRRLPSVQAIGKSGDSLRKNFNFVADVIEQCAQGVVCIESQVMRFGVKNTIPRGAGFIIKENGLILTNAHVVINKPQSFQVKLNDGRIYPAQVEYIDLKADLATIRIKENNLPVMKLGTSSDLRAGEWVIAIGSPYSLSNSVSAGVVSAPQRKGEDLGLNFKNMHYIQTDAVITFGSSGGPLVNLDGEVVGVNTMKVVTGISFAIPVEYVKKFLDNIHLQKKNGDKNSGSKRRYLGVVMLTIDQNIFQGLVHKQNHMPNSLVNKVLICEIAVDTPADIAGLQSGDIITEINGVDVEGVKSVYSALDTNLPLRLKIFRKNQYFYVDVMPAEVL